jgi:catechol 2,3-dioxygenase-like lactoylglutathione lyase family enzyme
VNTAVTGPQSRVPFRSNCEIAIHVPDLARAEAFYAGVLGFRVLAKSPTNWSSTPGRCGCMSTGTRRPRDHTSRPSMCRDMGHHLHVGAEAWQQRVAKAGRPKKKPGEPPR